MESSRASSMDDGDLLSHALLSIPSIRNLPEPIVVTVAQALTLTIFGITSFLFVTNPNSAALIERPTQSTGFGLIISGFAIVALHTSLQLSGSIPPAKKNNVQTSWPNEHRRGDSASHIQVWSALPRRHLPLLVLAVAIVLRVHAFEQVLHNLQCTIPGIEAMLPVGIVLWDLVKSSNARNVELGFPAFSHLDLATAVFISAGNALVARMTALPSSTTICPIDSGIPGWTVFMQLWGLLLDVSILQTLGEAITSIHNAGPAKLRNAPLYLGIIFILAAVLLWISGLLEAIIPSYRAILSNVSGAFLGHVLWASILFVPMSLCTIRILIRGRSLDIVVFVSVVVSCFGALRGTHNLDRSVDPALFIPRIPPLLFIFTGLFFYFSSISNHNGPLKVQNRLIRSLIIFSPFIVAGFMMFSGSFPSYQPTHYKEHPIKRLLSLAESRHAEWSKQANRSQSLKEAVAEYQRRYNRWPPPGFEKWYKFATDRGSIVIDDFDTIEENLRLFWKMPATDIRAQVKLLLSDTTNDCAELSIRAGEASIGNVVPTHRWMVEGIIKMMEPFVKELPDMDIAFNINDEPRVSVPYHRLKTLEKKPSSPYPDLPQNAWSENRARSWEFDLSFNGVPPLDMALYSFRNIWQAYGSSMCSPDSTARQAHMWDSTSLCTSCYIPHTLGPFLSNWSYAADPCHQPDLAHLHGFYMSPSAFKASRDPIPIFSQSKAGGFLDILYPSAWNYNDKVKYEPSNEFPDPSYSEKKNALFWRGSTTEGFSYRGTWKNAARQRLVNAANNSTLEAPILLPSASGFAYEEMTVGSFVESSLIKPMAYSNDVGFTNTMVRCDNGDCEAQERLFGLKEPSDFQFHWRNRYLLDVDGAGFSGRFLSFLQSRCLPMKTAIFREWWDTRVTPWKHYVPIDIRLHGLWSTIAYFATAGFGGRDEGKDPGEQIAEAGRDWANKVLRKEDMEIYLYRLLLEYARITDDKRDSLGYSAP